jgi:hypothetical protein
MPEEIADGTVTEAKLGDHAVTEAKLAIGSVNFGHLLFDLVKTGVENLGSRATVERLVLASAGETHSRSIFQP